MKLPASVRCWRLLWSRPSPTQRPSGRAATSQPGSGSCRRNMPQAGELLRGFLGGGGQSLQLPCHEVHHVVGVTLGPDAIDVPLPRRRDWVECEQPLVGQRDEELDCKKWIAAGL